uniref:C2 PI3K-type domain-containing protein n=1 Tax=Megaselia scalaris TaxID=36166 RepID=T1GGD5_MEGSC
MDYESFRYVYSSSLKEKLQIKIGTLEGENQKPPDYKKLLDQSFLRYSGLYSESCPSFQVKLELFNKGKSICLPVTTSYKAFTKRWSWNEWIQFNLNFCDIPKTAVLALTIYDCTGPGKTAVIGGTSISLFGKNGLFRQGMFDLRIWLETEGDGNYPTKTPGKGKNSSKFKCKDWENWRRNIEMVKYKRLTGWTV